jgi:hypothetical protein
MVKHEYPEKQILLVTPPGKRSSKELMRAVGGWEAVRSIKRKHLESCLFPEELGPADGVILRPPEYKPPDDP